MDPQFQELADRIAADVSQSVTTAINEHVTKVVTAAEARLSHQAEINAGVAVESFRTVAEAFGANLEAFERRMETMDREFSEHFRDHDGVLMNHARRLSALERKSS